LPFGFPSAVVDDHCRVIADRKINFEDRRKVEIFPDEQAFDGEPKISIDIKDTMICKQKNIKG
jgi:hypothetical protein